MKKIVLKVNITCQSCKRKLIQAVAVVEGIDKIEVDSEKNTLTVTGDADPVDVIKRIRKTGMFAEVVSIGPPPKPEEKPKEKKPEEKKPEEKKPGEKKPECPPLTIIHLPPVCSGCHAMDPSICTIL